MCKCKDCEREFHSICVQYMSEIWTSGYLCDGCLKTRSQKRKENRYSSSSELIVLSGDCIVQQLSCPFLSLDNILA
mgnify:CR=1 FL=1